MATRLMVCPPAHYAVRYAINPGMRRHVGDKTTDVDERFFHLDKALCSLASGHVMVYLDAFSPHAQTLLRRAIEPEFLIDLSVDDALRFAPSAVELGDAVLLHDCTRRTRERLHDAGYRVFRTDLSEFQKAGGSASSLVLRLDDGPALAAPAVAASA